MELKRIYILLIGVIACAGAFLGVLADLFSVWSNTPNTMDTAISVDIENIKGLFLGKPRWTFVLGNYLGVFFIPFHMLGFYLIYVASRPAGKLKSLVLLVSSFYLVAIGAGFHGTLAFIGDTVQSGNDELLMKMAPYWQNWGLALVAGYLAVSCYLLVLILTGKTLYARISALLSPFPVMVFSTVLIALLPAEFNGAAKFLAVTGLNLPLLIFYIVTVRTLVGGLSSESGLRQR